MILKEILLSQYFLFIRDKVLIFKMIELSQDKIEETITSCYGYQRAY
ncbi:hypothetical protein H1P_3050005 [Hyella patelloides LEGE 07179]|uniref:Uncharacterized protein n=1 Tax=Hyella patelloides LEGE 07179 TaxID=945734 RepID=A0A563VUE8_9CYAN|nr:hypothetical protein H1P_3050005 [Hyella patelloides LEGE 07179]